MPKLYTGDTHVIKCIISFGTGDRTQSPTLNNLLAVGCLVIENSNYSLLPLSPYEYSFLLYVNPGFFPPLLSFRISLHKGGNICLSSQYQKVSPRFLSLLTLGLCRVRAGEEAVHLTMGKIQRLKNF